METPVTRKYPEGETPTKMAGVSGELLLLKEVLLTALGNYKTQFET